MESSALNVAHQQHRKAETHLRYKRFDDAIQCHGNAASLIEDAMKLTTVVKSLESLHLQHDYHQRQQQIIRLKKIQFETLKKAMENKRKMEYKLVKTEHLSLQQDNEKTNLQIAIYKTMEEADSLLEYLVRRGDSSDGDDVETAVPQPTLAVVEGSKRPKDEHTVIEELRTLNHQLRDLIVQLVTQLDASAREADQLRATVRSLQAAAAVREGGTVPVGEETIDVNKHQTVTAGSTGGSSPFVFSPCGDIDADVHIPPRELPVLAPLEMPEFDFSIFTKRTSSNGSL